MAKPHGRRRTIFVAPLTVIAIFGRLPFIVFLLPPAAVLVRGCHGNPPAQSDGSPLTAVSAVPTSDGSGRERLKRCDAQAARVAAGSVWGGSSIDRGGDRPLRWVAHYSEKYDHC